MISYQNQKEVGPKVWLLNTDHQKMGGYNLLLSCDSLTIQLEFVSIMEKNITKLMPLVTPQIFSMLQKDGEVQFEGRIFVHSLPDPASFIEP